MNLFLLIVMIYAQFSLDAWSYSFNSKPETWTDAEVESFLFLSQVQKKSGLTQNSNLCIDLTSPVQGGKQRMRIISKVDGFKNGGLFETAKAEVKSGTQAEKDLGLIKSIVGMSTGYQQAIMDYDGNAAPVISDPTIAKQYMSAEVIGYTDGQGIKGKLNASLVGNQAKSYSSNKELGMLRAGYLDKALGLSDSFASVKKTSKESESAMKEPKFEGIRNCDTWRTAEVRMYFQTGAKVTDDKSWVMSTMMMPKEERALMQYEAARQVYEAQKEFSDSELFKMKPVVKAESEKPTMVRIMSDEMRLYCNSVFDSLKKWNQNGQYQNFETCKQKNPDYCSFDCSGNVTHFSVSLSNNGAPFKSIQNSIFVKFKEKASERNQDFPNFGVYEQKKLEDYLSQDLTVKSSRDYLVKKREAAFEARLKKKFPNCAQNAESYHDLKALFSRVTPQLSPEVSKMINMIEKRGYGQLGSELNGNYVVKEDIRDFVGAAITNSSVDRTGVVTKGFKCLDMKRVMGIFYAKGECRRGDEFSRVSFPHQNVKLGCLVCGSGWNASDGVASYKERDTLKTTPIKPHEHGKSFDAATVEALRSPGVHEISNCADCNCSDKASKLAKIYTVEKSSDENLVPSINKNSCYCTPPVAPSCGVGPSGGTDEPKITSLGQKFFYDACSGKFEKISGDSKSAQILNLLNTFNKGCVSKPGQCGTITMSSAINAVNNMLCEKQNFRIPSDDPIKDCTREDTHTELTPDLDV